MISRSFYSAAIQSHQCITLSPPPLLLAMHETVNCWPAGPRFLLLHTHESGETSHIAIQSCKVGWAHSLLRRVAS